MKWLKTLMNLGKIKEYAKAVLLVVVKSGNILTAVEKELKDTELWAKVAEFVPKVRNALDVVRDSLSQVLDFFGEDVTEELVALSETSVEDDVVELEDALKKLKSL